MDWFENWFDSEYYHLLYAHRSFAEADAFIRKLLSHLQPPAESRLLDLACGRGRHTKTLAESGYRVDGIDLSPSSIEFARSFETDKMKFYTQDMREPFRKDTYDYVFNFFTSFGYFESEEDHARVMESIAYNLKPGGYFLIDYLNSQFVADNLVSEDVIQREGTTFRQQRSVDNGYFVKDIEVISPSSQHHFQERVRAFDLSDFDLFLQDVDMEIVELFGDYSLSVYNEATSSRLIILAQYRPS